MTDIVEEKSFCSFNDQDAARAMAASLTLNLDDNLHPLCEIAVTELQQHLAQQNEWQHDFRLIGKMFGVLVVRTQEGVLGYLSAFSGKLANGNHHNRFVEPIFDGLKAGSFLNAGMIRLSKINSKIAMLTTEGDTVSVTRLKEIRKVHSNRLQRRILEQYNFSNKAGHYKNIIEIFTAHGYKQPPAGAGECAGPKLLQHAFRYQMEPLALAEFWWGESPKSVTWQHGAYYKPCKEKCEPILGYMLS